MHQNSLFTKLERCTVYIAFGLQDRNGGVHTVIRWSLLGSYVCFITTSLDAVDTDLLLRLCTTCRVPNYCYWLTDYDDSCTVLYKTLILYLPQVLLGCRFWELIGCISVTFGGDPNFDVADSLDGAYLGPYEEECAREDWWWLVKYISYYYVPVIYFS